MIGDTPMAFELVRDALAATLAANAVDRFSVDTFQRQSHAAEELVGKHRHVSVYYRQGNFEKGRSGWLQGPFKHAVTLSVELLLAAPASMDLNIMNDKTATPTQLMSALAASREAAEVANLAWDELARMLWQILISPLNDSLGLTTMVIEDRWISNVQKEHPAPMGEYVLLSGTMDYTCTIVETAVGDLGVPAGAGAFDTTLQETTDLTGAPLDPAAQGARST
jgi:hypothetical protein